MNEEFEILREKLSIQKLNAQSNFLKILQYYSIVMFLIVGVSLPIYFSFGLGSFLVSVLMFVVIFFLLRYTPNKEMKETSLRAFAIANLMNEKLKVDISKLNKEIDEFEKKIEKGEVRWV